MLKKRLVIIPALMIVVAALLLMAAAGSTAEAARGGKSGGGGGKKGGGTTTTCTTCIVDVNPDPVPLGSQSVEISGTGFAPNATYGVRIYAQCCAMFAYSDATGAFTVTWYHDFDWPDTFTVTVESAERVEATTTFTAQ